jgi:hypothetical protein
VGPATRKIDQRRLDHQRLTDCYHRHTGIKLDYPSASLLFQPDSPAYPESRYYQDAAIRAAFEKILQSDAKGEAARILLSLATGSGKTIIAANLLWRCHRPRPRQGRGDQRILSWAHFAADAALADYHRSFSGRHTAGHYRARRSARAVCVRL